MSHTISTEVFKFDELSDAAKENAREWWREASAGDNYFSESVIDDAKEVGRMLGFDVSDVYWSGFSSQGDGACIVGTWRAADVKAAELRAYAPTDKRLAEIRKSMRAFARAHRDNSASITHRDRYCHEHSVSIEVDQDEETFSEIARDFMRWIYRQLETQYDYEQSDEQVDDTICANEYTFTENGRRFG
jgi:hypothetical protein